MKELKKYQEKAIEQLLTLSKMYFDLEVKENYISKVLKVLKERLMIL